MRKFSYGHWYHPVLAGKAGPSKDETTKEHSSQCGSALDHGGKVAVNKALLTILRGIMTRQEIHVRSVVKLWIKALRSDKYTQIIGRLAGEGNQRCAVGVLCSVVQGKKVNGIFSEARNTSKKTGIPLGEFEDINPNTLGHYSGLNDEGLSFKKIALLLERNFL